MLSLSKKGFDSENGRGPSPILADRKMIPLPIPEPRDGVRAASYGNIDHDGRSYSAFLNELGYRFGPDHAAHLDPDLIANTRQREPGWRGMLGQVDQAESHLQNNGMAVGSVFLFWGWFDFLNARDGFHRRPGFSSLFGYLEVDQVLTVGMDDPPAFAPYHPHFADAYPRLKNRVYIARETLSWNPNKPGWGVFTYDPRLRLSIKGQKRSHWKLPGCFHPKEGCVLTYNKNREKWGDPGAETTLHVPARGQEYVCRLTPNIEQWVHQIIDDTPIWSPNGV